MNLEQEKTDFCTEQVGGQEMYLLCESVCVGMDHVKLVVDRAYCDDLVDLRVNINDFASCANRIARKADSKLSECEENKKTSTGRRWLHSGHNLNRKGQRRI